VVAAWRSGSIVWRMNEVTLCRARLVLGWVTVLTLPYLTYGVGAYSSQR